MYLHGTRGLWEEDFSRSSPTLSSDVGPLTSGRVTPCPSSNSLCCLLLTSSSLLLPRCGPTPSLHAPRLSFLLTVCEGLPSPPPPELLLHPFTPPRGRGHRPPGFTSVQVRADRSAEQRLCLGPDHFRVRDTPRPWFSLLRLFEEVRVRSSVGDGVEGHLTQVESYTGTLGT